MAKLEMKENAIYCAKCDKEMKEVLLPRYEFEEELPLHNVHAYRCNNCGRIFFTEKQAKEMKARTNELKEYRFGFERKLTISGRSLSLGIPSELASQLNLKKGQKVKIYPVSKEGFLIKKLN